MGVATHRDLKGRFALGCSGKSTKVESRDKWSLVSVIAGVKWDH